MIRLLLADDHAVVRDGLRQLLSQVEDLEVVATVGSGCPTSAWQGRWARGAREAREPGAKPKTKSQATGQSQNQASIEGKAGVDPVLRTPFGLRR
jgi:hypothetical protein